MATHTSVLAWRIPWTEEPGGLQSMGSQGVGQDWATNTCLWVLRERHSIQSANQAGHFHLTSLLRGGGREILLPPVWDGYLIQEQTWMQVRENPKNTFPLILPLRTWQGVWRQMAEEGTVFPVPAGSHCSSASSSVALETWILTLSLLLQGHKMMTSASHLAQGPRKLAAPSDWALPPVLSRAFCLGLVVWKQLMCQGWGVDFLFLFSFCLSLCICCCC